MTDLGDPHAVSMALRSTGYLPDTPLATAVFLARSLARPLLLEGEPGVGKTALAEAMAQVLGSELIRLQCYEGIDATQALYDWDFPRQVLHLRAVQAVRGEVGTQDPEAVAAAESELYSERFLTERPILRALRTPGSVLLIDELDRADDEFEAFLLEVLADYAISIPELGRIEAQVPPLVVITSNRTRELHDALKRRCLYHWLDHPSLEREIAIISARIPGVERELAADVAAAAARMRVAGLLKPPGVAEALDWTRALRAIGATRLTAEAGASTLGAAVKYREDTERVLAEPDLITGGAQ